MNQVPIGIVRSCYRDKFGTPRQPGLVPEATAILEIFPQFQPELSLNGLEQYSHLWVIFHFHQNPLARFHAKIHPPRLEGETMGLFATRSPHRPNPIGLSLVEIIQVNKNSVHVAGIDIIDGTPILDIKPYLPEIESRPEAKSGWTKNVRERNVRVRWQDEAKAPKDVSLRALIEKTIALDPRPLVYRDEENGESKYREEHAVRIQDLDIWFRFTSHLDAVIHDVRPIA